MVEIIKELPVRISVQESGQDLGGNSAEIPVVPRSNETVSQAKDFFNPQIDTTPMPVYTGITDASKEVISAENLESVSVPLNDLGVTTTTLSGDVPMFIENSSIEMAKKGGKPHDPKGKSKERELDDIRKANNIPPGTRVEKRHIPGKGIVPCKIKGGKVTPI
jgi:hypothetical protein